MSKFKKSKRRRVYYCKACKDTGKNSKGGCCICVQGIRSNPRNTHINNKEHKE